LTGFFMKFIYQTLIFIFFVLSIYSQEYTIIVKSNKETTQKKDVINITKDEQIHYTLDKLLEKEIGFLIQKYGGDGSYSLIRIRGSNANQVNLYLNGIPLNFAAYSEVDVSDLNVFNYQTIEVEKNGNMTGLTGSSIGGSINLIPDFQEEKNQVYVQGGSYKTFGGGIFYQQLYKQENEESYSGGWNISVYKETSDQNYRFRNHNGTIYFNTIDDFNDTRKNAQYKKTSSLLNGFVQLGNTKLQFLNDTFYRIHGIPGPITRQTYKTKREHLRNTSGIFTDTKHFFWDNVRLNREYIYLH
jgi:Outer membrane cobalamin receptor protein